LFFCVSSNPRVPKKRSSRSASASSGNPLESFFAKNPQVETVCYFALWYWLNIQFNIINKQIYNYFPFPWFVSAVHLAVGLLIMTFFWTTRLVKYEKPDKEFLKAVTLPSFLHAFGHCLTNVSFAAVAVSLTHTIKTLEPVFSAAGSFLVNGTVYAFPVYLALLPIIGGVALASATELSFSWLGFSTAMASNVAFSARAIFSKKLMSRMSPLNLYNFVTIVSLLFCIPFVVAFEGSTLAAGIQKAIEIKGQKEFTIALLKVGAFYHLYNQVAYQALGKVEPVTHAVGNVGKRIFVIGFTILAFGNKISAQTAIGSGIAVVGAGLYGWLKAKYADQTKTLKRD
jgi:solute carrier family 35 protein E1